MTTTRDGDGFGIDNLPYGAVRRRGAESTSVAVRLGQSVIELAELGRRGLLEHVDAFEQPNLNAFLELGPSVWSATRSRLTELLSDTGREGIKLMSASVCPLSDVELLLPVSAGDYIDFYSSYEHASNVGRIFRPGGDALDPNWRQLPVGYHGRAGSVVVGGTPIRRPCGQWTPAQLGESPAFGPEPCLDVEVELGFITGAGPAHGLPIRVDAAADYIFGFVLVNDWSARAIQRWEYRPLGPFLGKSFATSIGAWVIPLAALGPLRVNGPRQDPPPSSYLRGTDAWNLDLDFELALTPAATATETVISHINSKGLYWNSAQQLAHATSNGARVRAGDIFASGAISGSDPGTYGSLLELTWDGRDPLRLAGGETRTFLADGDLVTIRAAGHRDGTTISFGEVSGRIEPSTCARANEGTPQLGPTERTA